MSTHQPPNPEREAHRQAGEKYFEEVLRKLQAGKDPFQPKQLTDAPQTTALPTSSKPTQNQRPDVEDPDVQAAKSLIEGAMKYTFIVVFTLCTPASLVLTRSTLLFLRTPAVLFFLYSISIMGVATTFATQIQLKLLGKLNKSIFQRETLIQFGIQGLKQVAMFGILVNNSLYLGLACALGINMIVSVIYQLYKTKSVLKMSELISLGFVFNVFGLFFVFVGAGMHDIYSILMLILLIGTNIAQRQFELYLDILAQNQQQSGSNSDNKQSNQLESAIALTKYQMNALQQYSDVDSLFLKHLLTCAPLLIFGFLMYEGGEIVDHEPSVPTITVMLFGCATFALAQISGAVLAQNSGGKPFILAKIVALTLTIVFNLIERGFAPTGIVMLTLFGAVVVVTGQSFAMWGGMNLEI
eukprot:TRINITY_DN4324_c0_g1_i4.p1 TRINITY_DN4324_c0_g1~~TRINITY_DN4324_c0_g1_i4.p1  ORF type:complete len:423 (-),score=39.28 TRINITY_DN4324_c0_g1_i4:936-2171(-)